MHPYYYNYSAILVFLFVSIVISVIALLLPTVLSEKFSTKSSSIQSYECGIEIPQEPKVRFNINFYLIAISFVAFDVEIALLAPWALQVKQLSLTAFLSGMLFLFVLTVGLVYELTTGGFEL